MEKKHPEEEGGEDVQLWCTRLQSSVRSFMLNPFVPLRLPAIPSRIMWDIRGSFGYTALEHTGLIAGWTNRFRDAMNEGAVHNVLIQTIRVYPDESMLPMLSIQQLGMVCWYLFHTKETSESEEAVHILTALLTLGLDIDEMHEACQKSGCKDSCHDISSEFKLHSLRGYVDTHIASACSVPWRPEWPDMTTFLHSGSNVSGNNAYSSHPLSHAVRRMIHMCYATLVLPNVLMDLTLLYVGVRCPV